jgi:hypothetical protein
LGTRSLLSFVRSATWIAKKLHLTDRSPRCRAPNAYRRFHEEIDLRIVASPEIMQHQPAKPCDSMVNPTSPPPIAELLPS